MIVIMKLVLQHERHCTLRAGSILLQQLKFFRYILTLAPRPQHGHISSRCSTPDQRFLDLAEDDHARRTRETDALVTSPGAHDVADRHVRERTMFTLAGYGCQQVNPAHCGEALPSVEHHVAATDLLPFADAGRHAATK